MGERIEVESRLASIHRAPKTDEMMEKGLLEQQRELEELKELTKKQQENQVPPKDAKTSTRITLFAAQKCDTQPLQSRSLDQVNDFFSRPENANLLFQPDITVKDIEKPTQELLQKWEKIKEEQAEWRDTGMNLDYSLIVDGDPGVILLPSPLNLDQDRSSTTRFVEIINPPMPFAGISLYSVATIAIEYFPGSLDIMEYPEYQYTLLSTNYHAKGPSFLVWLFNKVLGIGSNKGRKDGSNNADQSRMQTMGFTRVFCKDLDTTESGASFLVANHARIEAHVNIPPFLLSMLPMSTEQLEAQGIETLRKEMTNDIQQAMKQFENAFERHSATKKP